MQTSTEPVSLDISVFVTPTQEQKSHFTLDGVGVGGGMGGDNKQKYSQRAISEGDTKNGAQCTALIK